MVLTLKGIIYLATHSNAYVAVSFAEIGKPRVCKIFFPVGAMVQFRLAEHVQSICHFTFVILELLKRDSYGTGASLAT